MARHSGSDMDVCDGCGLLVSAYDLRPVTLQGWTELLCEVCR